jgi:hypothetical protein
MVTPYDNNADLVIHSSLGDVFSKIEIKYWLKKIMIFWSQKFWLQSFIKRYML